MKIYLAGPMRGYRDFNFPAFHKAARHLRRLGVEVLSPAEHDEEGGFDPTKNSLEGFSLTAAMRWDIGAVLEADAVVVLPGWHASAGVGIEVAVARAVGTPVLDCATLQDVADESILAEAERIVGGARNADYGHPLDDMTRTGRMWAAILGVEEVTAEQVALCMVALKISRHCNRPKRDNLVDIAGYAKTLEMMAERRAATV